MLKNKILILSVATAVIGLLSACPIYDIVFEKTYSEELLVFYYGNDRTIVGITPTDDSISFIYRLNGFAPYSYGYEWNNRRLYIGDYCDGMTVHDGLLTIENGKQVDYSKTVLSPGGIAVAGNYLFVGSYRWYDTEGTVNFQIFDKNTLQKIGNVHSVQDLVNRKSVLPYNDGALMVLGSHLSFEDGKIIYMSGSTMDITAEWSINTYPSLESQHYLNSAISNNSLIVTSVNNITISIMPFPIGSGNEEVIDLKTLFEISSNNLNSTNPWELHFIGINDNEYIGFLNEGNTFNRTLFKYNMVSHSLILKKIMNTYYADIPVSADNNCNISENKLYTESYDLNGNLEKKIKVFSLDDFSLIKEISYDLEKSRDISLK